MNERWMWLVRYAVVIVLALILAAALGEMELFKTTRFGKTGLNASRVVQFFGYGGALLVFWLAAQRAAALIAAQDERWGLLKSILVPLATLIVVACAHSVILLVLGPVMSKAWLPAYNWTFHCSLARRLSPRSLAHRASQRHARENWTTGPDRARESPQP
jgi:hypothetical protein